MKVLNSKVSTRDVFNLTRNADHIMAVKGKAITITGVIIKPSVDADGVPGEEVYLIAGDKAYFGNARSIVGAARDIGLMFENEVKGDGVEAIFDTKQTGKGNTIWTVELK